MPDTLTLMSRAEFRRWEDTQDRRFERVAGQVVPMPAKQYGHIEIKQAIWLALRDAIAESAVACQAIMDGITVEVDDDTDYKPDVLVNAGPRPARTALTAPNPVVIVEVMSPSSRSADTGRKLSGYFRVPSIQHYLVVSARRRQVAHHRRSGDVIVSAVVTAGEIVLDPPGIAIVIDAIYRDVSL